MINILTITKHMGRLGNNMVYIINAIDYCLKNNIERLYFNEPIPSENHQIKLLLNNCFIDLSHNISNNQTKNVDFWGHYFYRELVPFYIRKQLAQKYIVPIMKIKPQTIDENALVIHIRGGDIFSRHHYAYVQPPLSFYEKIINSKKWSKIYLISEDNRNPCFDILKKKYNCISSLDNKNRHGGNLWGFEEDLSLMIGATNFVASKSSLSPLIIQLSKTIKNVFLANYFIDNHSKRKNNFEKNENAIWWSSDLVNKEGQFEYYNLIFNVIDCTNFINLFNKDNHDLSKPENKLLLVNN